MSTYTHQDKFYPSFVGRAARALFIQDMRGNQARTARPTRIPLIRAQLNYL